APVKSVAAKFLRCIQVEKFGLKGTTCRAAINLAKDQTPSAASASLPTARCPTLRFVKGRIPQSFPAWGFSDSRGVPRTQYAWVIPTPTLAHRTRKDGAPVVRWSVGVFLLPDPRVHRRVQQVSQKVHGYIRQANRQNASLHQIVIAIGYGLDG